MERWVYLPLNLLTWKIGGCGGCVVLHPSEGKDIRALFSKQNSHSQSAADNLAVDRAWALVKRRGVGWVTGIGF